MFLSSYMGFNTTCAKEHHLYLTKTFSRRPDARNTFPCDAFFNNMVAGPTYLLVTVKSDVYEIGKPFEVHSSNGMVIAAATARRVNSVI